MPSDFASAPQSPEPRRRARHQTLTIALHWITVLLVLAQFTLAILHARASDDDFRRTALTAHRSLGLLILLLVIGRIGWRLWGMQLPPFPTGMSKGHQWGARLSEWGLYGLLLAQPLTGLVSTVLRGRTFTVFGFSVPPLVTTNRYWAGIGALHLLGGYALATLVLIHASAAILHRLVANDSVLDSMLPARRQKQDETQGS
jgi:cytochrome b561